MPIYEYRCGACGHLLDALQKINDDPLRDCPSCAEPKLKRLISRPSFRLKGSGWYETDFKSGKERKRNLAEGGGDGDRKPADGDGQKSDSKPPDSKPPDSKPPDSKPSESKPSESKPSESKSGEGKSGAKEPAGKTSSTGSEAA
jgi:putative FmdB family regulatory protein